MNLLIKNKSIGELIRTAEETGIIVYLVGGAVRDIIRCSGDVTDIDVVVSCDLDKFVTKFSDKVLGKVINWSDNDRRVVFKQKGTQRHIDFAGLKGQSIKEDLLKRDISINAIAIDVKHLENNDPECLIDPLSGIKDLSDQRIKACSKTAFLEDPVRILRVLRFSRKYGYSIEPETFQLMKDASCCLDSPSIERIKKEFFTLLDQNNPKISIKELNTLGFIELMIPEINDMKKIGQGKKHKYDLFIHSLETISVLSRAEQILQDLIGQENFKLSTYLSETIEEGTTRRSLLVFAALLHDSGKVKTAKPKKDTVLFYGHEKEGQLINQTISKRLGLGKKAINIIAGITLNHMRILHLSLLENLTSRAVKRYIGSCSEFIYELMILSIADTMATRDTPELKNILSVINRIHTDYVSSDKNFSLDPLLNGHDITKITGLFNSPQIGRLLNELSALESNGKIESREEALKWLKQQIYTL